MAVKDTVFTATVCKSKFRKRLNADGLTMRKVADISPWSADVAAATAPPPEEPSESPRHFAASMDESVIVGYYTLKKCRFPVFPLSANLKERTKIHVKK